MTAEGGAPQLMGQLFQYFEAPNRFGLPLSIRCMCGLGRTILTARS